MADHILFPAIELSDSLVVVSTLRTECSLSVWRERWFDNVLYYDSNGHGWSVREAVLVREPALLDRILDRRIPVSVQLHSLGPSNLIEIKNRICSLIDDDPDDLYDQFITHEALKTRVKDAETPTELIGVVDTLGSE